MMVLTKARVAISGCISQVFLFDFMSGLLPPTSIDAHSKAQFLNY